MRRLIAFGTKQADCCPHCGEDLEPSPQTFILFSYESYYTSEGKEYRHTANLIIDGDEYASIHIDRYDAVADADIAYLRLHFIPQGDQTETTAQLISDFVKWARFEWFNSDKKNELPTVVNLIGIKTDRNRPFWYEIFMILGDARKITVNHLAYNVTSVEL